jgi:hypothetical protein
MVREQSLSVGQKRHCKVPERVTQKVEFDRLQIHAKPALRQRLRQSGQKVADL